MLEDFKRGTAEEQKRQREAAEKAARERAQASLAQMSVNTQSQSQNYPPAPSWMQVY